MEDSQKTVTAKKIGGEAFAECIRLYGPTATLDVLLKIQGNWIIDEFVAMIPAMATYSLFLKRAIVLEIDPKKLYKKLENDPDYLRKQGVL